MIRLAKANILTAFDTETVGSKVINAECFLDSVRAAVEKFDFSKNNPTVTTPGQGYIPLPESACQFVSAGVGRHRNDPSAYVLRSWRGSVHAYLRRQFAAPVERVAVVVYTVNAYLSDPDVVSDQSEVARIRGLEATHVLVAVLASAGPASPLSPGRLVSNLAGGNKDALAWDADTIRAKARESVAYYSEWGVVAD